MIETALQMIEKLPAGKERVRGEIALRRTESTVAAVVHGLFSLERQRAVERVCEFSEDLDDPACILTGKSISPISVRCVVSLYAASDRQGVVSNWLNGHPTRESLRRRTMLLQVPCCDLET